MKCRFVLIMLTIICFNVEAYSQRRKKDNEAKENDSFYLVSHIKTTDLNNRLIESRLLIKNWVFIDKISHTNDKKRLQAIHDSIVPSILKNLNILSLNWSGKEKGLYSEIIKQIDDLFKMEKYIMENLNRFENYDDPMIIFDIMPRVSYGGEVENQYNKVYLNLNLLIDCLSIKVNDIMANGPDLFDTDNIKNTLIQEYYYKSGISSTVESYRDNVSHQLTRLYKKDKDKEKFSERHDRLKILLSDEKLKPQIHLIIDKVYSQEDLEYVNQMLRNKNSDEQKAFYKSQEIYKQISLFLLKNFDIIRE